MLQEMADALLFALKCTAVSKLKVSELLFAAKKQSTCTTKVQIAQKGVVTIYLQADWCWIDYGRLAAMCMSISAQVYLYRCLHLDGV
jgi:hypothetical protein